MAFPNYYRWWQGSTFLCTQAALVEHNCMNTKSLWQASFVENKQKLGLKKDKDCLALVREWPQTTKAKHEKVLLACQQLRLAGLNCIDPVNYA